TGLVADKRHYDLFRKSPETPGRKRTGRRRTMMGMVLVTLSVQMLLDGFSDYLRKLLESS
ncbi:MAG: hypothetical protein VXX42_13305, partial [SAR324 cluster bacterium]|nr:hypothetical protein [SAR324 cluster bacterium]